MSQSEQPAAVPPTETLGEESKEMLAETGQSTQEALNLGRDEHAASDAPAAEGGEQGAGA